MQASTLAITASILSLGVLALGHTLEPKPGTWGADLTSALAVAKSKTNLVLVDFNASWCGPCQKYKKEVFRTKEFRRATKNLLLVDIDVDRQGRLAEKYEVSEIPDIRIMTGDGKVLGRVLGYAGSNGLLKVLTEAKRKAGIK